ncbi:MAG: M23 family metallopeptidase [Clostridia bacterium]|nr:M23 family metallopeptidase [Clostridia bacterium]
MLKRMGQMMDRWGHYALAVLCAAAVLLSALWTREQRAAEGPETQALKDDSQRLVDVTPMPEAVPWTRPVAGKVIRGFSEDPVYFDGNGIWQYHRALDFAAEAGESVMAMAAGQAEIRGEEVWIHHADGRSSRYRGLRTILVRQGQQVRAGEKLGEAGGQVPFEGAGHVCVAVMEGDSSVAYGAAWLTNP